MAIRITSHLGRRSRGRSRRHHPVITCLPHLALVDGRHFVDCRFGGATSAISISILEQADDNGTSRF
jgi:hypothetical protein